jgi:hypothetical protein
MSNYLVSITRIDMTEMSKHPQGLELNLLPPQRELPEHLMWIWRSTIIDRKLSSVLIITWQAERKEWHKALLDTGLDNEQELQ